MTTFRKLEKQDNLKEISEWIYSTDKTLFKILFFNDKIRAITGIERLITSEYINPYHRNFITILCDDENTNIIKGIIVAFKGIDITYESSFKAMHETSCSSILLILGHAVLDVIFASSIKDQDYYIGNLYVNEKYRKQGIGSKLVEKIKQKARQLNCNNVFLDVDYDKSYLLSFYDKLGFKINNKNYYRILGKIYGCYGLKYELK